MASHIQNAVITCPNSSPDISYRISYTATRSGYNVTYVFNIKALLVGSSSSVLGTGSALKCTIAVGGQSESVNIKSTTDVWSGGSKVGTEKASRNIIVTCESTQGNQNQTVRFLVERIDSSTKTAGEVDTTNYYVTSPALDIITISLDANGGTGGSSVVYFVPGIDKYYSNANCTNEISSISVPTRDGYTFVHYYGDGTSGGENGERYIYGNGTFADDLCTDITKNATLYALWQPNEYTITYNGNGGTYNGDTSWSETVEYGSDYVTWDNFFTPPEGYVFAGWKDGTDSNWTDWIGKPWHWTANYDVNLYAQWRPISLAYIKKGDEWVPHEAYVLKEGQWRRISGGKKY